MAGAKELRKQIGSIKNTQKITSAMQMVPSPRIPPVVGIAVSSVAPLMVSGAVSPQS